MASLGHPWLAGSVVALGGLLGAVGCYQTPVDTSELSRGPAPLRIPSPEQGDPCCYEDALTGGEIFSMYCSYCHNAPALSERPFASYRNVAAHMRVRANLTGKEYAKLMAFLRRWHDVPPPSKPVEPSPKRFIFSQPIPELRNQTAPPTPMGNPGVPVHDVQNLPPAPAPAAESSTIIPATAAEPAGSARP
jgi:hypothetical protein